MRTSQAEVDDCESNPEFPAREVHHTLCIKVDQLDAQILIICRYLSLSALRVSDSLDLWYRLIPVAIYSSKTSLLMTD